MVMATLVLIEAVRGLRVAATWHLANALEMAGRAAPGVLGFQAGQSTYRVAASFSPSPMNMAPVACLSRELPDEPFLNRALSAAANQATRQQ